MPLFGFDADGIDIHGSVLTTLSYSDEYNYLGETRKEWDFNNTELTLNGQYRFKNGLRVGLQLYGYELGEMDGLTLDWAVADYSFNQYIGVRAGRLKYQLGLYNNVRDVDAAHTFAVLPNSIYPKHRRPYVSSIDGVMLYGNLAAGTFGSLDYEVSYGTKMKDGGLAESVGAKSITQNELHGAGLIWNTPMDGLRAAYSYGLNGPVEITYQNDAEMDKDFIYHTVSLEYSWNSWRFTAEYQRNPIEASVVTPLGVVRRKETVDGYYIQAAYRVNDWLELGTYYNVEYSDKDDHGGARFGSPDPVLGREAGPAHQAWTKELAFAARFDITQHWLIKAEVHLIDGTSRIGTAAMGVPNLPTDQWTAKWSYFVLRTTFTF